MEWKRKGKEVQVVLRKAAEIMVRFTMDATRKRKREGPRALSLGIYEEKQPQDK